MSLTSKSPPSPTDYCPLLPPPQFFRQECNDCSALHQTLHHIKDFSQRKSNKRIGTQPSQLSHLLLSNLVVPPNNLFLRKTQQRDKFGMIRRERSQIWRSHLYISNVCEFFSPTEMFQQDDRLQNDRQYYWLSRIISI